MKKLLHSIQPLVKQSFIVAVLLLLVFGVVACGGGDNAVTEEDDNIAWININYSSVDLYADGIVKARIGGDAFISNDYVAHYCTGLACWFTWYDDSYPGVDITWRNLTTDEQGTATSQFGTITKFRHSWYAYIPVVLGFNQLEVTATDSASNSATERITIESVPLPPNDLRADSGDGQITLLWTPIDEITDYRIYWSTTPGTAYPNGATIDVKDAPYTHIGLINGTTYYYVITSHYLTSQSEPSEEIMITAGTPSRPENLSANLVSLDILLTWDDTYLADTYTLYWANESGVTKQTGTPITGAISPYLHTELNGIPYYYVVTAVNGFGEGLESKEVMATSPQTPPTPTGLSVTQREDVIGSPQVVDLSWGAIPGAGYEVYRRFCGYVQLPAPEYCNSAIVRVACQGATLESIGNTIDSTFSDWTVLINNSDCGRTIYEYNVTAHNDFGESLPSETVFICVASIS